jgi:hypothetical protein
MSTLASIVGNDQHVLADWESRKANPELSPLAKFHAKFWGKEEPDTMVGEHGDGDDMEIDNPTAEGSDIDPVCCVLDIDIPAMEDKVLVRSEYIKMFKYAEEFYARYATNFSLSPCLVISGQPGIGEFC